MRISHLNGLTLGVLGGVTLASCLVTLTGAWLADSWDHRVGLAQRSYAEHLSMQANVHRLFKQHADALLFGDLDTGTLESVLKVEIALNLHTIREIIAEEIQVVGEEEAEELELLAEIEAKVAALTGTLTALAADGTLLDADTRRDQLVALFDSEVDKQLSALIARALRGELAEVEETMAEAAAFRRATAVAVVTLILGTILLTLAAGVAYHRSVVVPARLITATVTRFRNGDFSAPPPVWGAEEFRDIGSTLTLMSEAMRQRQENQHQETRRLESAVSARTAELSRLLGQIERAEAMRRQMMADVSHELRTPLTIIRGEADVTLRAGDLPVATLRDSLARIRDTARHANAIVDDLLLIARQEAGKLRLDLVDLDPADLARQTAEMAGNGIAVVVESGPVRLKADPVRLRQSLLALLQNARRYGGKAVTIRLRDLTPATGPRLLELAVEDDGPGMSDSEKAQAFERFFRGTNASGAGEEGSGLGLPIVRSIAVAHGGEAGLEDRPGGGLRVWLRLPVDRGLRIVDETGSLRRSAIQ
jgi:signal transduction histidine kinase